ncbi:MAG: hypothetical protein JWL62_2098, partial [Hyphomicrobiales bacterium]|nr:hypothetical protein [Hyphomicrobiales bacterium]
DVRGAQLRVRSYGEAAIFAHGEAVSVVPDLARIRLHRRADSTSVSACAPSGLVAVE